MKDPNPNGANQYQLDPRQKLCWDNYINPKSETFGNATQSALKTGYTQAYADQITTTDWFVGRLWVLNSVNESEKVFKEILETNHKDLETGKVDSGVLRIKADIAKFLASTKGKDEGYSTRTETDLTSKGEKVSLNTDDLEAIKSFNEWHKKQTSQKKSDK
jgi:hypothetical protein